MRPDLSGNPFFAVGKALAKKDWERKAEIGATKNINLQLYKFRKCDPIKICKKVKIFSKKSIHSQKKQTMIYAGNRRIEILRKYIQEIYCKFCDEKTEHLLIIYCKAFLLGIFYPLKWWASDKNGYMKCRKCNRETQISEKDENVPAKMLNYFQETKIPFGYKMPSFVLIGSLITFSCLLLFGFFSVIMEVLTPVNSKLRGKWKDDFSVYQMYIYPDKQFTIVGQDTIVFGKYTQNNGVITFPFIGGENQITKTQTFPLVLTTASNDRFTFNKTGKTEKIDDIYKSENNKWRTKSPIAESDEQIRKKVMDYLEFEKNKCEKGLEYEVEFFQNDPNSPIVFASNGIQVSFYSVDKWRFLFHNDQSWEKANKILNEEFPPKGTLNFDEENLFKRNSDFLKAYIYRVKTSDLRYLKAEN